MLVDSLGQLGSVARKLGITQDEARIRRAVEFASFKTLQSQEAESGFIEKSLHSRRFFRSGRAGGWRETLTPGQAAAIEHLHPAQTRRLDRKSVVEGKRVSVSVHTRGRSRLTKQISRTPLIR